MNHEEFKKYGTRAIEMSVEYFQDVENKDVCPSVKPGYLQHLLPKEAPTKGENFDTILDDVRRLIEPGLVNWQSPHFHAYYPGLTSYPAIIGDMLCSTYNSIGFSWATSPVVTELETVVLDWLAKLLHLPEIFLINKTLNGEHTLGGGVIQNSASESLVVCLIAAREEAIARLGEVDENATRLQRLSKMIAYCSDQTHSSFVKGCHIGMIESRVLRTNEDHTVDAATLEAAIKEDMEKGLVPFFFCATLGTTSTCSMDDLTTIGPVCASYKLWLHCDSAYAGPSFICEEYRPLLNGVEFCSSFNFNCHKWMLIPFDCSPLWVQDRSKLIKALNTQFVMFNKSYEGQAIDYKDWQIGLGRRFRSLKLWFVLRTYGVTGIQNLIRKHCLLATHFKELVLQDDRFVMFSCRLGLCCFKLKGDNHMTSKLEDEIKKGKTIDLTATVVKDQKILRFVVCSEHVEERHVNYAWEIIQNAADKLLNESNYIQ